MKIQIKVSLILALSLPSIAYANYEVEKLMDSYLVAKAEMNNPKMDEEALKSHPYVIQVASYINEKDAVSHVNELKSKAEQVKYYPAFVRGQVWFKVYVGEFATKEKAESYRKEFVKKVDEPFAVVVSLLDQRADKRTPSSVAEKKQVEVPAAKASVAHADKTVMPEVKLIPKHKVVAEAHTKAVGTPHIKSVVGHKASKASMYTIQIGSFSTEEQVKKYIQSHNTHGEEMYYKSAVVDGKTWYRLFLGKFSSKNEAEVFHSEKKKSNDKDESFIRRLPASE